ncbi:hypothetical protein [Hoyosella altamirensis]|uniref:Minor tail protein n=1 Tax=Hoyosella altamirensis TaxID=616997 RepID=A0A839RWD1_9ACTN|nr:hypothetical protein [Hoyosella altamirensis]MBB3040153.1 hypothetical protein [Hoyosella altamirensis]
MILVDEAQIIYRSPSGRCWHLSGRPFEGREGVTLGTDPQNMHAAPTTLLFQEGARQIGATYTGRVVSRRDVSIEVSVRADSQFGFSTTRTEWLKDLDYHQAGWLHVWTPQTGWRTLKVRKRAEPVPFVKKNATKIKWDKYMIPLVAENPYWEGIRETSFWRNKSGLGRGTLHIRNPGVVAVHPRFTLVGPGTPWIQDGPGGPLIEFPAMQAGEVWLVDTNPRSKTIRTSTGMNLYPRMRGRKFRGSYPPGTSTPIEVRFTGNAALSSQILAVSYPRYEGWM